MVECDSQEVTFIFIITVVMHIINHKLIMQGDDKLFNACSLMVIIKSMKDMRLDVAPRFPKSR